jgi:hypothetical protein
MNELLLFISITIGFVSIHETLVTKFSFVFMPCCLLYINTRISVLIFRYKIFGLLLEKLSRGLDSSLDNGLYPSLTLLTACTLSYTDKGRTKLSDVGDLSLTGSPSRQGKFLVTAPKKKVFDFYRDGYVEEVKQCFPILVALTVRVKELLAHWSDHPTLKQVSAMNELNIAQDGTRKLGVQRSPLDVTAVLSI